MTEQRYALLIGNSEFPHETGLAPLRCPPNDVQGLAKVLAERGQFQVTSLINETKREIEKQLERALNQASKEDLLLIYFSGHGRPSNLGGQLYLAAQDTELGLLQSTAIAARHLKAFIDESRCSRIMLILDCCYSGAIDDAFLKGESSGQVNQTLTGLANDQGHGLHIMTASTAIQTAEEKQGDRYSVFTKHLINGISTGAADQHANGVISFNDLFVYVEQQLKTESRQKPQVFNLGGGDLLIAYSGKSSRKERCAAIKPFLLGLHNEQRLTAKVYAEAVAILEAPEARLTDLEKHRDDLLGELYAKEMESAVFVEQWALAGVAGVRIKGKPTRGDKKDIALLSALLQLGQRVREALASRLAKLELRPLGSQAGAWEPARFKKQLFIVVGIAAVTAGWTTGKFDVFFVEQNNAQPAPAKSIEPTAEQQYQQAAAKIRADAVKVAKPKRQEQLAAETKILAAANAEREAQRVQAQKIKGLEPNMIAIPAGSFMMGSPGTEKDRGSDERQHKVSIGAFYLGQTEVTKGQFSTFVAAANYYTQTALSPGCNSWSGTAWQDKWQDKSLSWRNVGFVQTDLHPVVCVSWNDAQAYIAWLNAKTGKSYRLPTEAEWEYAARAGTTTPFSFGNNITPEQVNYNGNYPYADGAKGLYRQGTVAVMSLPANPWGLYETHGNVWEWCADEYKPEVGFTPVGPETGSARVLRGGSWHSNGRNTRSALRNKIAPTSRSVNIGFRLALG